MVVLAHGVESKPSHWKTSTHDKRRKHDSMSDAEEGELDEV